MRLKALFIAFIFVWSIGMLAYATTVTVPLSDKSDIATSITHTGFYNGTPEEIRIGVDYQSVVGAYPNTVNYWKFDNNAFDSKGTNTLSLMNGATYTTVSQFGNYAGDLTGGTTRHFQTASTLDRNTFSVCGWIKKGPNVAAGVGTHIISSLASNGWGFYFQGNVLTLGKIDTTEIRSTLAIADNNWHFVGVTYNGTSAVFYVDGTTETKAYSATFSGGALYGIMGRNAANTYLVGVIDELELHSVVLTSADMSLRYNKTLYNMTSPSPVGVWTSLPLNSSVTMTSLFIPENMNSGETGSVEYSYYKNNGAASAWMTNAQMRSEPSFTVTDSTNSLKIVPRYNSNGLQTVSSHQFGVVNATLGTTASAGTSSIKTINGLTLIKSVTGIQ